MSGISGDKMFWQTGLSKQGWENEPVRESKRSYEEKKAARKNERLEIYAKKTNANHLIMDNAARNKLVDERFQKLMDKKKGAENKG